MDGANGLHTPGDGFAHPDDETFICGGTLARLALEGAHVTLVTATLGEMGRRLGRPAYATRETLPVLREKELHEACDALGITALRLLGLRDKTVDYYEPAELAGLIRVIMEEVRPDVVITFHEAIGGHYDHCAVGRAATMAWEGWRRAEEKRASGEKRAKDARLYYVLWQLTGSEYLLQGSGPARPGETWVLP